MSLLLAAGKPNWTKPRDILFANAGIADPVPSPDATTEHYDKTFGVNTRGVYFTLQKALPLMKDGRSVPGVRRKQLHHRRRSASRWRHRSCVTMSAGTPHRCGWAEGDPLLRTYHDEEWGVPEYDSRALGKS